MMIVAMDDIGLMFPGTHPINSSDLKSCKALCIIIITIYLLPV